MSSPLSLAHRLASNIFELQPLEVRRLLAVTSANIETGGVLHVIGSGGDDTITVNLLSNGKIGVSDWGTQFTAGAVTQILIEAGSGADNVQIFNGVIYGSSTITGNSGNDNITGGRGADTLFGRENNDV